MSTIELTNDPALDEATAEAERNVLGASLQSPAAFERCQSMLKARDFYNPAHEYIWDAIAYLNAQGSHEDRVVADPTLVMGRLAQQGHLAAVGGGQYVHALVAGTPTVDNALHYARMVKEASALRSIVAVGTRLKQGGASPLSLEDRDDLITASMQALEDIGGSTGVEDPTAILGDSLSETLDALEGGGKNGITTGLDDLDELLGGLVGGQVIVVGARPGTGKTVIAQEIATHVARDLKRPAMLFTMEMTRMEMLARIIASECKVNSRHVNLAKPALTEEDWARIAEHMDVITEMPLHVCDEPTMTPARLNALVGAFKRKNPDLGVVVIDYLGLMEGDGRQRSRQEEIGAISREIKKLAKRHNVPVVLLSQLNRKSADRSDGRPAITDLRDSGAVEQDADVVILLHREDQYDSESPRAGEMDLLVVKHRGGPTGDVTVAAQMHYYRLSTMGAGYGGGGGRYGSNGDAPF